MDIIKIYMASKIINYRYLYESVIVNRWLREGKMSFKKPIYNTKIKNLKRFFLYMFKNEKVRKNILYNNTNNI